MVNSNVNKLIRMSKEFSNYWKSINLKTVPEIKMEDFKKEISEALKHLTLDNFPKDIGFISSYHNKTELSYSQVYNDDFLLIMLMFLPENHTLEYHDHPNMIVYSKIFEGEVILSQFNLINPSSFYLKPKVVGKTYEITIPTQVVLSPNSIAELYPNVNNIHSMHATKRSVVLDVIFNYYDDSRPCSYFEIQESDPTTNSNPKVAYIREE